MARSGSWRAFRWALVGAMLAVAVSAPGAGADPCDSRVIIFGTNSMAGPNAGFNAEGATCAAGASDTYDGRIISPGSDAIFVLYVSDLHAPSVVAHLRGLGYDADLVLQRSQGSLSGSIYYQSALLPIDPVAQGCVTATVRPDPSDPTWDESNSFHTLAGSC